MTIPRVTTRRSLVLAVLAALLIAPFIAWQGATGDERVPVSRLAPHGIVVVGDSITARYNDEPGDADQGWWSITGDHFDAKVTRYAQSGSGYLRPGHVCTGNTFIDRPDAYAGDAPSLLIVEGGRNDWATCEDGQLRHGAGRRHRARRGPLPRHPADVPAEVDAHRRARPAVGPARPGERPPGHRDHRGRRPSSTASSSSARKAPSPPIASSTACTPTVRAAWRSPGASSPRSTRPPRSAPRPRPARSR